MQTRELISARPDGSQIIFTQRLLPSGEWHNQSARPMTEHSAKSGSGNTHARKSPSASERWTSCTASIAYEAANADRIFPIKFARFRDVAPYLRTLGDELHGYEVRALETLDKLESGELKLKNLTPDQKKDIERSETKRDTREGTRAHDFAADVFAGKKTIEELPEEFQEGIRGYIEECRCDMGFDTEEFIETQVSLWYSPGDKGTLDYAEIREGDTPRVKIRDLKWGEGVLVHNIENPQFAIYARSLIEFWEEEGFMTFPPDTEINIAAYQPRHREAAALKPWIITLADLRAFTEGVDAAVAAIDSGDVVFAPSDDACRWCLCKGFCEARVKAATEALENPEMTSTAAELLALLPDDDEHEGVKNKTMFAKFDPEKKLKLRLTYVANLLGEPMEWVMADEILVRLFKKSGVIKSMLDDIDDYLTDRVLSGEKIEGLKIVTGREGNRAWGSEEEAEKLLKQKLKIDDYKPRELVSVTTAEKLLAPLELSTKFQNLFGKLVTRSAGKKTVVSDEDKREAVSSDLDMLPDDEDELDDLSDLD